MKTLVQRILLPSILVISMQALPAQDIRIKDYKTINYALNIEIDYAKELVIGRCLMTIENNSDTVMNSIPLLLYRLFNVSSISDVFHKPLSFSQEVVPFIDWPEYIVKHIVVSLPEPLYSKQQYTLEIEYAGKLMGNQEAQRYVHDHISKDFTMIREDCYAYPKIGVPIDREVRAAGFHPTFDYTIHVEVPKGMKVVNAGHLDSLRHTDDQSIYSFSNIKTAWRMDVCIADYSVIEDHDTNLNVFYFPEDSSGAERIAAEYRASINFYTGLYGRISALDQFTIIEVPSEYGGQADVSGALIQSMNFAADSDLTGFYHELSHHWDPYEIGELHMRWNEGLAEFHQYYLLQELGGKIDALDKGFESSRGRFINSVQNNPQLNTIPFSKYGTEGDTDLSYLKGMMFFTVIYRSIGEDRFFEMMKSYYQKYYISGVTLDEFVAHLKAYGDPGMEQIIEDWIYGTRSNNYIIDGLLPEEIAALYKK